MAPEPGYTNNRNGFTAINMLQGHRQKIGKVLNEQKRDDLASEHALIAN